MICIFDVSGSRKLRKECKLNRSRKELGEQRIYNILKRWEW